MTTQVERRIAILETLPVPIRTRTPEEVHADWIADAARCGFTEAQVMSQFGGWPEFVYAKMTGEVVDPTHQKEQPGWFDELLAKHNGSGLDAYLEMLGVGRGRA